MNSHGMHIFSWHWILWRLYCMILLRNICNNELYLHWWCKDRKIKVSSFTLFLTQYHINSLARFYTWGISDSLSTMLMGSIYIRLKCWHAIPFFIFVSFNLFICKVLFFCEYLDSKSEENKPINLMNETGMSYHYQERRI